MLLPDCVKVAVGHVAKTHGVKGEMAVMLDPAFDLDLEPGSPVIVEMEGLDVPYFIGAVRPRGSESILLTLDGIESEADAAVLAGRTLYVYVAAADVEADFADDDEFTADRLVGYTIVDGDITVGRIADVRELGPDCWYFVLEGSGSLIPIADEFITEIDHASRLLTMNLPVGLLDIQ
ncbi:MAG: hypothetical protein K2M97_02505 [Muribaculaceae bacterium]|nr:hypothetical protein [Muribaculaceae bacterium]